MWPHMPPTKSKAKILHVRVSGCGIGFIWSFMKMTLCFEWPSWIAKQQTILPILNVYVAPMPRMTRVIGSIQMYGLRVIWWCCSEEFLRWLPRQPSWTDIRTEQILARSENLKCPTVYSLLSSFGSIRLTILVRSMSSKEFQNGHHSGHSWTSERNDLEGLFTLNLHCCHVKGA